VSGGRAHLYPFLSEESLHRPREGGAPGGPPYGCLCSEQGEDLFIRDGSGEAMRPRLREMPVRKMKGAGVSPIEHPKPQEKPAGVLPLLE